MLKVTDTIMYLLLFVSLASGTIKLAFSKKLGLVSKKPSQMFFFNGLAFAVIFLMTFSAWLPRQTGVSPFTALLALLFSAFTLSSQLFNMKAMATGPAGICALFYCCGFVISAFAGIVFWNETLYWSQLSGVIWRE